MMRPEKQERGVHMEVNKTVRVTFDDFVMLFGNSYKPWEVQFDEFIWLVKTKGRRVQLKNVETSNSKWIAWGGLKWCPEEGFQQQLNREGCQGTDADNPMPRKYSDMVFKEDTKAFIKAQERIDRL